MYTTGTVATIVGKSIKTIVNHINLNYLKAKKVSGSFEISQNNLNEYISFLNSPRTKKQTSLTKDEFVVVIDFIKDIQDGLELAGLIDKYQIVDINLASLKAFILHERNIKIVEDRKSMTVPELAKAYSLSISRIEKILLAQKNNYNKEKQGFKDEQ